MELFIPSVLLLLLAAAVVFFILPRFGAPVLALVSVALLVYGIYQHMNAFGTEYRLSTWQLSLVSYAPYIMIGGLLVVIAFYLISLSPLGKAGSTAPNMPEMPSVAEMPNANSATNALTAGVNNALKGAANVAAAVGIGNAAKANNKAANMAAAAPAALAAPAAALGEAATGAANALKNAASGATNALNKATNTLKNTFGGITNALTGNKSGNKPNAGLAAALGLGAPAAPSGTNTGGNRGTRVPGLNFRLTEV